MTTNSLSPRNTACFNLAKFYLLSFSLLSSFLAIAGFDFVTVLVFLLSVDVFLFGVFFFGSFYLIWRKQWQKLLPFIFVLFQMFLFSFAAEKGARYLCVVLPFEAMAVMYFIHTLYTQYVKYQKFLIAVAALMTAGLLWQSFILSRTHTDYKSAIDMVLAHNPQALIISTQPVVESLFVANEKNVIACPKDPALFAQLLKKGYRYLIIDPQAYISWTSDQQRFTLTLIGILEMVRSKVVPVAVLGHIEGPLLQRFVLDHNQDLFNSLNFLKDPAGKGSIYIYDLNP